MSMVSSGPESSEKIFSKGTVVTQRLEYSNRNTTSGVPQVDAFSPAAEQETIFSRAKNKHLELLVSASDRNIG